MEPRDDIWSVLFRNNTDRLVALGKRLYDVQMDQRIMFPSGDETLEIVEWGNWTNNQCQRPLPWGILQSFTSRETGNQIISACEVATIAGTVVARDGPAQNFPLVPNGADNTNALCWMANSRAGNRAAQKLLALFHMRCILYDIEVGNCMIRGLRKVDADFLTTGEKAILHMGLF